MKKTLLPWLLLIGFVVWHVTSLKQQQTPVIKTAVSTKLVFPTSEATVYPYSVVPGGVHSENIALALQDDVVATHYSSIDTNRLTQKVLPTNQSGFVSYRIKDEVYWTAKRVTIKKGETVLTDGVHQIRGRCGNRISETPRLPIKPNEPSELEFDTPVIVPMPLAVPAVLPPSPITLQSLPPPPTANESQTTSQIPPIQSGSTVPTPGSAIPSAPPSMISSVPPIFGPPFFPPIFIITPSEPVYIIPPIIPSGPVVVTPPIIIPPGLPFINPIPPTFPSFPPITPPGPNPPVPPTPPTTPKPPILPPPGPPVLPPGPPINPPGPPPIFPPWEPPPWEPPTCCIPPPIIPPPVIPPPVIPPPEMPPEPTPESGTLFMLVVGLTCIMVGKKRF